MAAKLPSCRNWYSSTNTTCDRIQNHGKPQTRFNHFFSPDFTVHKFYVHEIWILGLYERNKFLGLYEQYTIWGLFEFYFLVSGFESDSDLGIRVWIEKKEEEKEKERRKRIGRIKVFMVLLWCVVVVDFCVVVCCWWRWWRRREEEEKKNWMF